MCLEFIRQVVAFLKTSLVPINSHTQLNAIIKNKLPAKVHLIHSLHLDSAESSLGDYLHSCFALVLKYLSSFKVVKDPVEMMEQQQKLICVYTGYIKDAVLSRWVRDIV